MNRAKFTPPKAWIDETMVIAERYGENRGVFREDGEFVEERVKPGKTYLWTTDQERARRVAAQTPKTNAA